MQQLWRMELNGYDMNGYEFVSSITAPSVDSFILCCQMPMMTAATLDTRENHNTGI